MKNIKRAAFVLGIFLIGGFAALPRVAAQQKPNIVVLMTDDTGWGDFGAYGGGAALGHPTPNVDRIAKEGAVFASWYGQASCTAGRASSLTGRVTSHGALRGGTYRSSGTTSKRKRRPSPSSSRRTATRPTSRANGIWVTKRVPTRSSTASTR